MDCRKIPIVFPCNTHFHSPFSFSSFGSIEDAVATAKNEGVALLGINDFATCDGFPPFAELCRRYRLYPLFNIELAIRDDDDPPLSKRPPAVWKNAGRRICGKAISHPLRLSPDMHNLLADAWRKSQDYIWNLIDRLNGHLGKQGLNVALDYNDIRRHYAKKTVSERHVARALYDSLARAFQEPDRLEAALVKLFGGISVTTSGVDPGAVREELLNRLLKNGALLAGEISCGHVRLEQAHALILEAGGIPCYPVTEVEDGNTEKCGKTALALAQWLLAARIFAVEFFPSGAGEEPLTVYARIFSERGFCVTFGTGYDASNCPSLTPALSGNGTLERISWEGACMLAAHQELRKQNKAGFVGLEGELLVTTGAREEFIAAGEKAIKKAIGRP